VGQIVCTLSFNFLLVNSCYIALFLLYFLLLGGSDFFENKFNTFYAYRLVNYIKFSVL
jgi:hypothetical protein